MLGLFFERLAFFRAVDPAEPNAFSPVVVENFDGVAIEDGDDWAGGSHRLKRQGSPLIMVHTDAVPLRSVSLFSVVPVGKQLHLLSSEKTYV